MLQRIEKILGICDRHFFARFSVNKSLRHLKLGPPGELLRNNIYQEWVLTDLIRTENVFPYNFTGSVSGNISELIEPFTHAKLCTSDHLPFGIAVQTSGVDVSDSDHKELECDDNQTILKTYMFLNPENSTQYFDEWQQSQKAWWTKISACPGRFTLTDVHSQNSSSQVQILADFGWGKRVVETICLNTSGMFDSLDLDTRHIFELKQGRKKIFPDILISSFSLENAVITFLCDAYDESTSMNLSREVMRFHRKIAPYKASFSISSSTTSTCSDLCELAEFLTKQLRSVGISTLLLPDASKKSLESQFVRNDEIGIPYTVVMNDSTLKNGIIALRSRDTTLKEQVHITELKKYMLQLYKNY
ncbi:hypothetical protein R5R35_010912 [Gryllus longicercus]|uniref:Anticodon-binding domain-containing protein n=1 Tax=Gryllus longicercus TaxID=2509291 RepID=A0AAN9UZN9_9ORTH